MEITKVYPLDAVFDNPEDVPEDVMDKSLQKENMKWVESQIYPH
jgi:enoyl-[acyl-carrier protein] reductase I